MSVNIFDKILKIVQIIVTILQFAIKSFTGATDEELDTEE